MQDGQEMQRLCFFLCLVVCSAGVDDADVIIIGAGPAGLSTLHHLLHSNLSVALLEKSEDVGGRIRTLKYGDLGVDLGPAWIHYGTANVLTYLAGEQNCSLVRTRNLNMDVYHNGTVVPRSVVLDMFRLLDQIEDGYNKWKDANSLDASLLLVFQQIFDHKKIQLTPEQQAAFAAILFGEVVEDWTVPLHELSAAKHCEYDNVDGVGSDWRVVEGMQCVLQGLVSRAAQPAQKLMVHLQHAVSSIRASQSGVQVEGERDGQPRVLSAQAAVVALPLGELKEGRVAIEPLPTWKKRAWQELGLGHAIRVALHFHHAFWPPEVEFFMDFMANCTSATDFNHFLQHVDLCSIEFTAPVLRPKGEPPAVLVAEADGRLAEELLERSDAAVTEFLLGRLREMFGVLPPLHRSYILRPWGLPFWHKESKGRESARLAGKALGNRMFFAGDYVSHHVGTVAAAYLSGIAAAHAVLCQLGHGGLDLENHPAIRGMLRAKCAEKVAKGKGRKGSCSLTLWDLLYQCSALPDLEDESGRSCFVQGHDRWRESHESTEKSGFLAHFYGKARQASRQAMDAVGDLLRWRHESGHVREEV